MSSQRPHPPTAIYCADDQLVPDIYRTLQELNRSIPSNVSVLGRGDLPISTVLNPQLTTFAIHPLEMGKKAAELLIEAMQTRSGKVRRGWLAILRRRHALPVAGSMALKSSARMDFRTSPRSCQ